jgi:plasmid stability protein
MSIHLTRIDELPRVRLHRPEVLNTLNFELLRDLGAAPSTMISSCNHSRGSVFVGQVIIRSVDDRVLERLKAHAAAQRKSLEQSLRDLLTEAASPSRAELLADLERIRLMTPPRDPGVSYPTAEQLIREGRGTQ